MGGKNKTRVGGGGGGGQADVERDNKTLCDALYEAWKNENPLLRNLEFLRFNNQKSKLSKLEENLDFLEDFSLPTAVLLIKVLVQLYNLAAPCSEGEYCTMLNDKRTQLTWRLKQSFESVVSTIKRDYTEKREELHIAEEHVRTAATHNTFNVKHPTEKQKQTVKNLRTLWTAIDFGFENVSKKGLKTRDVNKAIKETRLGTYLSEIFPASAEAAPSAPPLSASASTLTPSQAAAANAVVAASAEAAPSAPPLSALLPHPPNQPVIGDAQPAVPATANACQDIPEAKQVKFPMARPVDEGGYSDRLFAAVSPSAPPPSQEEATTRLVSPMNN